MATTMEKKAGSGKRRRKGRYNGGGHRNLKEPKWKEEVKEIEEIVSLYDTLDSAKLSSFADFPLSASTKRGLRSCGYAEPTDIQVSAIPLALQGKDVLGAAKTGSGKTLAFLIPLLELLWRNRWSQLDGMGALVISPTRELAYQTFEVLRRIGGGHDFSAGLVTGGKDIETEKERILQTNIIICTPGRLLQHMDETVNFDCSSLKLLVLDEADRILDLGFERTMNAIIQNLPSERQTLLFSATQTRSVRDLARLSLVDPEYVAVHEGAKYSTPHKLVQSYVVCELPQKLSMLYSFIKSHLSSKTLVFLSSCKQVKFVYETFRRMRPGTPLMALYGRQKHLKRMGIYNEFCKKKSSVLFCTDIAARGLDIPSVDWVVQLDCPEDTNTYIHRAGRTARYEKEGKALIFLLPSEVEGMLAELEVKKIPIQELKINPKKIVSITKKLAGFCAQDVEVKACAKRSFICYLRSVHLQSNKGIFDINKLPIEEYALSLGLPVAPRVRFLQKVKGRHKRTADMEEEEEEKEEEEEEGEEGEVGGEFGDSDDEEDSDILFVKSVIPVTEGGSDESRPSGAEELLATKTAAGPKKTASKVASLKKLLNKNIKMNTHIKFDDEGSLVKEGSRKGLYDNLQDEDSDSNSEVDDSITPVPISEYEQKPGEVKVGGIEISRAQKKIVARDRVDKKLERQRIQQAHRQKRLKKRKREGDQSVGVARLSGETEDEIGGQGSDVETIRIKRKCKEQDVAGESGQLGTNFEPILKEDEELAKHLLGL